MVLEDIERQVRGIRELHERLGDTPRTLSSAPAKAGVPDEPSQASRPSEGASSLGHGRGASSALPSSPPSSARDEPSVADLVARVQFDLADTGVKRTLAKRSATQKLLELRGLRSLRECGPADGPGLRALLATFEAIDRWDTHDAQGAAPTPDERSSTSA